MKYGQVVMGMFIGAAIGGSVVASTTTGPMGQGVDENAVREIVRDVIAKEPKLIMDSLQKFHLGQQMKESSDAEALLSDPAIKKQLLDDSGVGSVGPKDSTRVVIEFFDYNCPACKMQYREIDKLVKLDPTVRVLFREYPIFGAQSEANSRLGMAVAHVAPEKYFAFYEKMHSHEGRAAEKDALAYIKELGIDVEKVQAEAKKPEIAAALDANRRLGDTLNLRGTPSLVVNGKLTPHAMQAEEILSQLGATESGAEKTAEATKPKDQPKVKNAQ